MIIRKANKSDIDEIMTVYDKARQFMRDNGNNLQWINGYPQRELIESDIEKGELFVCDEQGEIAAVFAFIIGDDPTYAYIEGGSWKSDAPYGTLHRIGSTGKYRGMGKLCFDYCKSQIGHVRGDTHEANLNMQKQFLDNGFERCGIIYISDGSPRIVYEYVAGNNE